MTAVGEHVGPNSALIDWWRFLARCARATIVEKTFGTLKHCFGATRSRFTATRYVEAQTAFKVMSPARLKAVNQPRKLQCRKKDPLSQRSFHEISSLRHHHPLITNLIAGMASAVSRSS